MGATNDEKAKNAKHYRHALLIVGNGIENGIPFFTCRNSWGATYGCHGYFKIAHTVVCDDLGGCYPLLP